jgi:hypothetical protein
VAEHLHRGVGRASPIQQASTGLVDPLAASITARAASEAAVIACGASMASTPSTCSSARQAATAVR